MDNTRTAASAKNHDAASSGPAGTVVYAHPGELEPQPGARLLEEQGFNVRFAETNDEDALAEAAQDAVALVITYANVSASLLQQLRNLRVVATMSAGVDMIDLNAAQALNIWVANIPDASVGEVATHALTQMLSLIRQTRYADRIVRDGKWIGDFDLVLRRPADLTVGIVGMGLIGRRFAEIAGPIFGRVLGYDPAVPGDQWPSLVERCDLEALTELSDAVTLHVPLIPQTKGLFDQSRIACMKYGSVLVNVARGGIIDEAALLDALDSCQLSGAALDVFETEPPNTDDPIRSHPKLLLSPHTAYLSDRSLEQCALAPAENIIAWHLTGRPIHAVVAATGSAQL